MTTKMIDDLGIVTTILIQDELMNKGKQDHLTSYTKDVFNRMTDLGKRILLVPFSELAEFNRKALNIRKAECMAIVATESADQVRDIAGLIVTDGPGNNHADYIAQDRDQDMIASFLDQLLIKEKFSL